MSSWSLDMLEDMTGYDSSSHVRAELEGIKVVFPSDRVGLLRGRGFILNRTEWLRGIAHKLGTLRVYLNEKVGDVSDLNGDIVVGADGPWSVVRRHVGGRAEIRNVHQKETFYYFRVFLRIVDLLKNFPNKTSHFY